MLNNFQIPPHWEINHSGWVARICRSWPSSPIAIRIFWGRNLTLGPSKTAYKISKRKSLFVCKSTPPAHSVYTTFSEQRVTGCFTDRCLSENYRSDATLVRGSLVQSVIDPPNLTSPLPDQYYNQLSNQGNNRAFDIRTVGTTWDHFRETATNRWINDQSDHFKLPWFVRFLVYVGVEVGWWPPLVALISSRLKALECWTLFKARLKLWSRV